MKNTNWKIKLGIILIVVSIPIFLVAFLIPFLDFEAKTKVTVTTSLFIAAEVIFWSGGLLVGKELFTKYKAYMNPKNWFKKKSPTDEIEDIS